VSVRPLALLTLTLALTCSITAPLFAQTGDDAEAPESQRDLTWRKPSGLTFELFPASDVMPVYVADPHRPTNAVVSRFYFEEGIPSTRSPRTWLAAGGRFGVLRIDGVGAGDRSLQVSIEAGLDAVFDTQYKNDGLGWDGNYGLAVTTASDGPWAFKVAIQHISAHLADEYSDRTGRRRINYTREEVALATAYRWNPRWRAYGELGGAYIMRSDEQEHWRLQWGLEYESRPRFWGERFSWYAATDFGSWQERDWRLDSTWQTGFVTRRNGRAYRILMEFMNGRPQMGEFYEYTETSLSLGLRMDL
jgi:hypothetical protein